MLDAYIIERIRREREQRQDERKQIPLYIDERPPREPSGDEEKAPGSERGSVIIDLTV